MGRLKLKSKHIKIAYDNSRYSPFLSARRTPEAIIDHFTALCRRDGYKLKVKPRTKLRLSKVATTYYKEIRLPWNWSELEPPQKAKLIAHEYLHTKQWRHFKRAVFGCKYIMSVRFRAAVEIEAHAETARAMMSMGYNPKLVEFFSIQKPRTMKSFYALQALDQKDFQKHFAKAVEMATGLNF